MREDVQELIIIGGGVMGLCTAYAASHFTSKITILEKLTIGNQKAASFSYTRSIRSDYLDPVYARLAYEARRLWQELERTAAEPFIFDCGCLNIAKASVTPDLAHTYAEQSYQVLRDLHL
ncbi:MAG TPA: FAD-dependent oxidoreductase, partial [Ktedonobacteraceae bacterium]|nr:FAD-dependent oxidoreductase [Ktedonobacteraceae bacterium]